MDAISADETDTTAQKHSATEQSLAGWLALLRCPGIGPRRFRVLLDYYQEPRQLLDAGPGEINRLELPQESKEWLRQPDWHKVEEDLDWLRQSPAHHILTQDDSRYPERLKQVDDAPPLLFVTGRPELLKTLQLGMVGSRNPSAGGRENAFNFAQSLSRAGLTITSGMALGIDAAAHEGALAGSGLTIAVTGTGLDRVYPARHRDLAHRIAEQGALISEFPTGTPPLADHFPRRNRIISGLSLGVLVVEAAPRSGSQITARCANEQGREVFAIPGSIHNPLARGCHNLIRQGAKLVETIDDIVTELGITANPPAPAQSNSGETPGLDANSLKLLSLMGHDPVSIDTLVARSGLAAETVTSILLVLEIQGMVSCPAGGLYIKATEHP
jgi:DNA processing protein